MNEKNKVAAGNFEDQRKIWQAQIKDREIKNAQVELLDFGVQVFNEETEKFLRWLRKPNSSLGGVAPESLLGSLSGIKEVRSCLNRLEYGNFA